MGGSPLPHSPSRLGAISLRRECFRVKPRHAKSSRVSNVRPLLALLAGLGLLFQVGHFGEHAFQFAVWMLGNLSNICGRDTPWMSPWVAHFVQQLGLTLAPGAGRAYQLLVGVELLHLIGNSIFLTGLLCLYGCMPGRWVRWAIYIEAFHFAEHAALTSTAFLLGQPVGISSLFGYANMIGGREFAVGYRVAWHFAMNLLPMPFAMISLMQRSAEQHL